MQWEFIVALVVGVPIIFFPVAFLWYLNIGGIYAAIRQAQAKRAAAKERTGAGAHQHPAEVKAVAGKH